MGQTQARKPEPPKPPRVPRRIRLRPLHGIGIAVLAAVPVCAALGVFGSSGSAAGSSATLELLAVYPERTRYEVIERVEIHVRNRSNERIDRVTVRMDPAWLDGFAQTQFTPEPVRPGEFELTDLPPGETRRISGAIQGERYGRYSGTIVADTGNASGTGSGAESAGNASAAVDVATFVFP